MNSLNERLTGLTRLMRGRGFIWTATGLGTTLLQAVTENLLAMVLILFLFSFGLVDFSHIPHWFPSRWVYTSPELVLALLLMVSLLRTFFQLMAKRSFHALLELVRARLCMIQGYYMLVKEQESSYSLSDVNMMMGEYLTKASDYVYHFAQLLAAILLELSLLAGMLWLSWKVAFLGLLCLFVFSLPIWLLNHLIKNVAVNIPKQRKALERTLVRICRNHLLIHAMRLQREEHERFLKAVVAYFQFSCRTFFLRDATSALPPLLGILSVAVMVGTDIKLIHTPAIELVAFIYLFNSFSRNVGTITDHVATMSQFRSQFDKAANLLVSLNSNEIIEAFQHDQRLVFKNHVPENKPKDAYTEPISIDAPIVPPKIELRGVSFTWPEASQPVFDGFNLLIPAGSCLGVVGPNGSGKTTLLALLLGVITPGTGVALIDDLPARQYVLEKGTVGYVGTDNLLIFGSVRDNLLYGLQQVPAEDEIWKALASVGLDEKISTLPDGWNYMISENEEGLSSGQKQQLSLARAFLRKPALLILDEASASLDLRAEAKLTEAIDAMAGHSTVIIVSHKPATLRGIDRIIQLKEPNDA
ncbi:MAG: ABC transporter ATP-binding protein [Candidatus Riflebacteria bacterium]|nr:ABC transporter ATP-binding protein [Candidatus Riflebacteria bacterium]